MAYYDYKIKQNFPCGCRIDEMANGSLGITYCPKHKAAPDMYEALRGILLVAQPCDGAKFEFEKTYIGVFRIHGNRLEKALEVLAKAEGKE